MAKPETSAISVLGNLENPTAVCFDPTLLSNPTALREIVRHQISSYGSQITITKMDEGRNIRYSANDLYMMRYLDKSERLDKIEEIAEQMAQTDVLDVILSTAIKEKPLHHQVIFTRNHPEEFANSLENLDFI